MAHGAETDGDRGYERRQKQPDLVDDRVEQERGPQAEAEDDYHTGDAMHRAKAREQQAQPVEPVANRVDGQTHVGGLCM